MKPLELTQQLQWRYATKQFSTEEHISEECWQALLQSLVLSPSSFGLQPWKFLVVKDRAVREQLQPVSWNQPQVTQADYYVVLLAKKDVSAVDIEKFIALTASTRGIPAESLQDYKNLMLGFVSGYDDKARLAWATNQVYVALGQLLASCAVLGVDACPMEGIDRKAYDSILQLEDSSYTTIVSCAIGVRSSEDKYAALAKVRYSAAEMIAEL